MFGKTVQTPVAARVLTGYTIHHGSILRSQDGHITTQRNSILRICAPVRLPHTHTAFYRTTPPPMPDSLLAKSGYFSCTWIWVLVASAYEMALTSSPSVLASSAARSKYLRASVTRPCWRSNCAMVATAISHSGSTTKFHVSKQ